MYWWSPRAETRFTSRTGRKCWRNEAGPRNSFRWHRSLRRRPQSAWRERAGKVKKDPAGRKRAAVTATETETEGGGYLDWISGDGHGQGDLWLVKARFMWRGLHSSSPTNQTFWVNDDKTLSPEQEEFRAHLVAWMQRRLHHLQLSPWSTAAAALVHNAGTMCHSARCSVMIPWWEFMGLSGWLCLR